MLDGLINTIPFLSAYSCIALSSALVAGPITSFIPFAAKCFSFSKLTDGFVCVSSITSSIPMLEWVLKRYSLISLVAIFSAAPSDSPKDEDTPVMGRRAPIVTVCCFQSTSWSW